MTKKALGFRFVLALLFTAIVGSFGVYKACCEEPTPHKIGVILGLSGAASVWSENARMGLELARDEINAAGGVKGRKIELLFEDSKTEPAQAVAAYHKLTKIDKVKVVVGDIWAHLTNPLIPLANNDRVILVSPTITDASDERTGSYFFTMGHKISSVRKAVDDFFKLNKEVRSVGILCWDDSWGQAYLRLWREVAAENGVAVADVICTLGFENDHRAEIARLRSKKVDAIITAEWTDQVMRIMKEQHFNAKLLGTANMIEAVRIRNADNDLMEGAFFTYWQANSEFMGHFKAKFGKEPILEAENSYEILRSIARALGSSEGDTLASLKKVRYEGVGGPVDWTGSAAVNQGIGHLYQVRHRRIVVVN